MHSYLKEIADQSDIRKNVIFQIVRHTFATKVTLRNGVPIETVSIMLGYKSLKHTQHYANIVYRKITEDMHVLQVDLLQRYLVHLRQGKRFSYNKDAPPKPVGERRITNHLIIIRTIYNRAITAGQASKYGYHFGTAGKIAIKFPQSSKMGLNEDEIKAIEDLDLSTYKPIYNDAGNIWLTEFYFAGMRVTDCCS